MQKESSSVSKTTANTRRYNGAALLINDAEIKSRWSGLTQSIEQDDVLLCNDAADLAHLAGSEPESRFVVFYPNPILELARLFEHCDTAAEAIEQWTGQCTQLLDVYRKNRRGLILVDGDAASTAPAELAELLDGALAIEVKSSGERSSDHPVADPGPLLPLAYSTLNWNERARALSAELEASSLPLQLPWEEKMPEILRAALAGQGVKGPGTDDLSSENELLLLQLHQVQEELEAFFLANKELERIKQASAVHIKNLDAQIVANNNAAKESEERLRTEQIAPLNDLVAHQKRELEWKLKAMDEMKQSLSWKLTAPIRAVAGLFVRNNN